jgi:hypothetical protein
VRQLLVTLEQSEHHDVSLHGYVYGRAFSITSYGALCGLGRHRQFSFVGILYWPQELVAVFTTLVAVNLLAG